MSAADQIARLDAAAACERDCWRFEVGEQWDEVEAVREAAAERAAIVAEASGGAVGCSGLVSLPTTPKNGSAYRSQERGRALRAKLNATEIDKHRMRLSRMRRSVGFTARAIDVTAHQPGMRHGYLAMVTMTYEAGKQWSPMHIARALDWARLWHKERGLRMRYVWVGELQTRGALHYHAVFWMPSGVVMPKWDLAGWWPHGSTRGETARDAVAYLMKYLSKGTDTSRLPKGARMHGSGGVDHTMRRARRWLGYPAFIRARADVHDDWNRATGGGWYSPESQCVPSEYERSWVGDRYACIRVADHGRPFAADGAFTWLHRREEFA